MCLVVNPRSLVDCLLPFDAPAPGCAGPVVDALGEPDAQPVAGAAAFPASYDFQVVDVLHDPDEFLGLHQVERHPAIDVLSVGDDALGDIPDNGSLDDLGEDSVLV